jgi:putative DNA primase/helicase
LNQISPIKGASQLPRLTQDRAALGFVRANPGLRYDVGRGVWFEWNGSHWRADNKMLGIEAAREFCRDMADQSEALGEWSPEIERESFAAGVERIARSHRGVATATTEWDADEFLLGTPGGTVDLRTGFLRPAKPDDLITRTTLVAPASSSSCSRWRKFLSEATGGDNELMDYLQRFIGYSLTGVVREHALLFIHGPGGNGKSVFANVVGRILKDYATVASFDTFTESKGDRHSAEIATLAGARLVSASEPERGRAWAESKVKLITGGDEISARYMHCNPFTFRPQFKLLFTANDKPVLRSVGEAMRRRFHVIRFAYKPPVADTSLEANLVTYEAAEILRWAIDGAIEWQRRESLCVPQSILDATSDYLAEFDVFGPWLEARCKQGASFRASAGELWKSWSGYAGENGLDTGSQREFSDALQGKGFARKRDKAGNIYTGLRVV